MKKRLIRLLATAILLFATVSVQAVITCTMPTSTGFSTAYATLGVVPNVTQGGNITFTCTRTSAADITALEVRANNGTNTCAGAGNDARFGGSCIGYEAYQNSSCTTLWTGNSTATGINFTLASVLTPQPITLSFWGCITAANQAPAAGAGTYTDTVTMTIRNDGGGGPTYATNNFPVSVTYPATCNITVAVTPNTITFPAYTAFQNTALVAPTSTFSVNCTSKLPYTVAFDVINGVAVGLLYTLTMSPTGTQRGSGANQVFTITATIPANQAGTCATSSCNQTNAHSVTITY